MLTQLLPLGSVVTLSVDDSPDCMVIGYYPTLNDETHDYLGVPLPTGLLQGGGALSFDRVLIKEVLHLAPLTDDEAALVQEYQELTTERDELIRAARQEIAGQEELRDA